MSDSPQPYRVLARKYRPQSFGELIGQDAMVQTLANAIKRDRIALIHMETLAPYQGRWIGERLVRFALGDARRRSLQVIAICPYVRAFVERHPEMQDIVVGMDAVANGGGHAPPA